MDNKKKILLVEDEVITAVAQKRNLEKQGYDVETAVKGEDAVCLVLNNDSYFDVILMDIDLGDGIDGTQAAEQILKERDIPVIFLSSHTEPHVVEKTEKITSYGYVVKNSGIVVLDASIKMALKLFDEKLQRRCAEDALCESELSFRKLFEESVNAILLLDKSGVFVECNKAALKLLKMTRAQFLYKSPVDISPEYQMDGQRSVDTAPGMIEIAYEKGLHRFDWTCVNSEGDEFIVEVSLMPIKIRGELMLHTTWRDITERKNTEETLRQKNEELEALNEELISAMEELEAANEELISSNISLQQAENELLKSQLITENIPVGLYLYHLEDLSDDRTLRMVYANPAVKILTGVGPEDVVGRTLDENFPGLREKNVPQNYAEVVRSRVSIEFVDLVYGDNRVESAAFSVKAFPLPGNHVGVAFENITARRKAEEVLSSNYSLLQIAGETAHFGGWSVDLVNNICTWSDAVADIHEVPHGYSPPVDEGINFYAPEWKEKINEVFSACAVEGISYDEDMEIITQKGKRVWVRTIGRAVRDRDGKIIKVQGSFQDITDHKRAEEELRLFKESVENSSDAVGMSTPEGKHYYQNSVFDEWFGEIGENPSETLYVDRSVGDEVFQAIMAGGKWNGEVRMFFWDRSIRTILLRAYASRNASGCITALVGIHTDITECKKSEEEIQRQLAEKETLLREVHHRIKNNMAKIESLLFLQSDSAVSSETKAALQDSVARIQSMRILYDKLLLTKDYEEISFKSYAEALVDSFISVFEMDKKITIEKKLADFRINSKKAVSVGIIINELLTNVFKYAFIIRGEGNVLISVDCVENRAVLVIHDNGTGIDEKFEVQESSGLGLTIVKMLAEQLNGTFTVSNENGTKSVVQFEI